MGTQIEVFEKNLIVVEPDDPDLIVRKHLPKDKKYIKFYLYFDDGKNRERIATVTVYGSKLTQGEENGRENGNSAP